MARRISGQELPRPANFFFLFPLCSSKIPPPAPHPNERSNPYEAHHLGFLSDRRGRHFPFRRENEQSGAGVPKLRRIDLSGAWMNDRREEIIIEQTPFMVSGSFAKGGARSVLGFFFVVDAPAHVAEGRGNEDANGPLSRHTRMFESRCSVKRSRVISRSDRGSK